MTGEPGGPRFGGHKHRAGTANEILRTCVCQRQFKRLGDGWAYLSLKAQFRSLSLNPGGCGSLGMLRCRDDGAASTGKQRLEQTGSDVIRRSAEHDDQAVIVQDFLQSRHRLAR